MKHLIIHNQKVCGIFDTFEAALAQAVHTFPQGEFIIQQVISDNAIVGFFYTSPWTDEERKDIRQVLEEIVADGEVDLSQFY